MYFLYYDRAEKYLILQKTIQNTRSLELLETSPILEKLIVRSDMYKRQYRCELNNLVDKVPSNRIINKIKNVNMPRRRISLETRRKMSESKIGRNNNRYGIPNSEKVKASKSAKLIYHYQYHIHGKTGYKDSDQTRREKSVNNNNKGGWFWICNHFTKEEKRNTGDTPVGWRKGRLRNYSVYIRNHKKI